MKRIRSATMALLFVFVFSGCTNSNTGENPPAIASSYEADAKIDFNDVKINFHIIQSDFDEMKIEIHTPEELKGLIIEKTGMNVFSIMKI